MKNLAELNENNICIGVKTVINLIDDGKHVEISDADFSQYAYRKFENGLWSEEKYEPVSTAPIDEFTQLKAENVAFKDRLAAAEADNLTTREALAEVYEMVLTLQV